MVKESYSEELQEGSQPVDESWWAAVLAEEEESTLSNGSTEKAKPAFSKAHQFKVNWVQAKKIYDSDETVTLEVVDYNRGGLLVESDDLQGFVPISHLVDIPFNSDDQDDDERDHILSKYLASAMKLKVIECDRARGRVVFSERAALFEPGRRIHLLENLQPSEKISGTVTNITDFGIFVDLGGLEGLIHVSELSWGRVRHPTEVLNIGDEVDVYVISIDQDRQRVALSLKRLHSNPWEVAEVRYHPGQQVEAHQIEHRKTDREQQRADPTGGVPMHQRGAPVEVAQLLGQPRTEAAAAEDLVEHVGAQALGGEEVF